MYMRVCRFVFVSIAYIVQTSVEEYVYTTADLLMYSFGIIYATLQISSRMNLLRFKASVLG